MQQLLGTNQDSFSYPGNNIQQISQKSSQKYIEKALKYNYNDQNYLKKRNIDGESQNNNINQNQNSFNKNHQNSQ